MNKIIYTKCKLAVLLVIIFLINSCALSKALYLGKDRYTQRDVPHIAGGRYTGEDINGVFPEAVYIKTRTQTFNVYHYYILHDGRIWYKNIDGEKEPKAWTIFEKTGLPPKTAAVAEISADADEIIALSNEGVFYRYCFDKTIAHKSNVWLAAYGWPAKEQLVLDGRTANNRSWAMGKRNSHVLYYEDPFGNQHHNGTMEIVTIYALLDDGQEICYADTGLPLDFSRNFIGPERGAFKAASLAASASTMFVINDDGEMYTRLADFDTAGCDPMWFKYTYIPYTSNLSGTDYFSNLNEWGLPSEDWHPQPRIPLAGKAAVTRCITIVQNGQGNGARELRVAGLNAAGTAGYWSKPIFGDTWDFIAAPLFFPNDTILKTAAHGAGERGASLDTKYTGYHWNGGKEESGWKYEIPNFNLLEGDCDFRITWRGETCTLKLHPVEMWTYLKRDYLPGRTGAPKIFFVTLEIPDHAFDTLTEDFTRQLTKKFAQNNRKLFRYTIAASNRYILMRDISDTESLWFLTDVSLSNNYTEFQFILHIENYPEVRHYYAPELTVDAETSLTPEILAEKITLNRQFRNELKYKIRTLKWEQLTAFKFNFGYIPAHYITKITPLGLVDVPKIRTVTSFGETLVLANSASINAVSNARIWLYEKLLALLETRIRCYNDISKNNTDAPPVLPPWYAGTISAYWDRAGLPHTVSGAFFTASGNPAAPPLQIPAVLSLSPVQPEHAVTGWNLSIGGSDTFIFIDPRNVPKTIYARRGKTPAESKVKINGTLYVTAGTTTPLEQYIILNSIGRPMRPNSTGIDISISYNGELFEIHAAQPRHGSTLIFRGQGTAR